MSDASGGSYLSPEPLLQDPYFVAYKAEEGDVVRAYAYASSNPLRNTDPTGLFVNRSGQCDQWAAALKLAKRWAGCSEKGTNSSCQCQQALASDGACDICKFLDDGKGPDVWMDRDYDGFDGHTNVGSSGLSSQHPLNSIAFDNDFCSTGIFAPSVARFAELMIHEAMHYCESVTRRPYLDRHMSPVAGPTKRAPQCRSWDGE